MRKPATQGEVYVERPQWAEAGSQYQLASHIREPLGSESSSPSWAVPCGREMSLPCRALPKLLLCRQINVCCCCKPLNFVLFWFLVVIWGLHKKKITGTGISTKMLCNNHAKTHWLWTEVICSHRSSGYLEKLHSMFAQSEGLHSLGQALLMI